MWFVFILIVIILMIALLLIMFLANKIINLMIRDNKKLQDELNKDNKDKKEKNNE